MTVTDTIAGFIIETDFDHIPREVTDEAKVAILDLVGVSLYGSDHEIGDKIRRYVTQHSPGTDGSLFGQGSASVAGAALANGTFAHAIDYDDSFGSIMIHPSSPTFPAALASAEYAGSSTQELLRSYIIGIEVTHKVGQSVYPAHGQHQWHGTGTIGSFGATAAASTLLGLSKAEIRNALGIVGSCSSALSIHHGKMTKPLHPGHAAQMGVRAALLAKSGFTANEDVMNESRGYGTIMTPNGEYTPSSISKLGNEWGIRDITYKPYPTGVIMHAPLQALSDLLEREDLKPEHIENVEVELDEDAEEILIPDPKTPLDAKFSLNFCLASMIVNRCLTVNDLTEAAVHSEDIRREIEKITKTFRKDLFEDRFFEYGARLTVSTTHGVYELTQRYPPGSPRNPLSLDRIEAKFERCTKDVLSATETDSLKHSIYDFDSPSSLDGFLRLVQ